MISYSLTQQPRGKRLILLAKISRTWAKDPKTSSSDLQVLAGTQLALCQMAVGWSDSLLFRAWTNLDFVTAALGRPFLIHNFLAET